MQVLPTSGSCLTLLALDVCLVTERQLQDVIVVVYSHFLDLAALDP